MATPPAAVVDSMTSEFPAPLIFFIFVSRYSIIEQKEWTLGTLAITTDISMTGHYLGFVCVYIGIILARPAVQISASAIKNLQKPLVQKVICVLDYSYDSSLLTIHYQNFCHFAQSQKLRNLPNRYFMIYFMNTFIETHLGCNPSALI